VTFPYEIEMYEAGEDGRKAGELLETYFRKSLPVWAQERVALMDVMGFGEIEGVGRHHTKGFYWLPVPKEFEDELEG
jgi:hypothetical protein